MEPQASKIEAHPVAAAASVNVDLTGGLQNGEEVKNIVGAPTGEIIVHELDAQGNVTGWHKEIKQ